mmetsp:Transcript_22125/g.36645  ORF Transcript_22125/g.36645 Transcript_22125/m.36645 type:complete len:334 (+) Transcript_22125:228-1229(+)|eukprot:CAMPEP_0184647662 /NCGR_PEP_ID=MMETSP0308-20130426/4649_1 /TAXON_ID=38269 /ORGANISM="Gloeochaete witrockiana, Strain SAG 46.84" /LENGTH=333 /DNA_ID=CAMNT_0027078843 /DNA_START=174 /DNA_END=1175 /DNA_ORIENTATION=-
MAPTITGLKFTIISVIFVSLFVLFGQGVLVSREVTRLQMRRMEDSVSEVLDSESNRFLAQLRAVSTGSSAVESTADSTISRSLSPEAPRDIEPSDESERQEDEEETPQAKPREEPKVETKPLSLAPPPRVELVKRPKIEKKKRSKSSKWPDFELGWKPRARYAMSMLKQYLKSVGLERKKHGAIVDLSCGHQLVLKSMVPKKFTYIACDIQKRTPTQNCVLDLKLNTGEVGAPLDQRSPAPVSLSEIRTRLAIRKIDALVIIGLSERIELDHVSAFLHQLRLFDVPVVYSYTFRQEEYSKSVEMREKVESLLESAHFKCWPQCREYVNLIFPT